jgi:hypothetical protein
VPDETKGHPGWNRFAVSAQAGQTVIVSPSAGDPLSRADVLNLVCWLAIVGGISSSEVLNGIDALLRSAQ